MIAQETTPALAPAVFIGAQEFPGAGSFELFNLLEEIAGHPAGSTVSRQTLERAGYFVPATVQEPNS